MHWIDQLYDWVTESALSWWAMLVVFLGCTIDGFFPPVPSESLVTAVAAVLAKEAPWRLILLGVVAASGAWLGDNIAYLIGRRLTHLLRHFPRLEARVHHAARRISRRGTTLIIIGRFIPGGRIVVNMGAGLAEYPHPRFMVVTVVSAAVWAVYSVVIGVVAGHAVDDNPLLGAAIGVGLGIVLGWIIDRAIHNYHVRQGNLPPDEEWAAETAEAEKEPDADGRRE